MSHGLFIYEHEGYGIVYSNKTNKCAEYYSLDCANGLKTGINMVSHPEYYISNELVTLTFDFANHNDFGGGVYGQKGDCDCNCDNCICSDCLESFCEKPPVKTLINWWTMNNVLSRMKPTNLKNFDPRHSHYHLLLECKIKHIGKPKENSKFKRYEQKITLYDNNSNKEIPSLILGDEVFFESEFESGDSVIVLGDYYSTHDIKYQIHKIKLVKKSDKKKPQTRNSPTYNKWRESVIERDEVCKCCGGDKALEAHHIFNYKNHESLRENVDNGVALCKWCHQKYHSYYGKEANPLSFNDFLNRFGRDDSDES